MNTINREALENYRLGLGELTRLQAAIFGLCGGGILGNVAAIRPADFYIDDRSSLPNAADIEAAVKRFAIIAEANGHDPHDLPVFPHFHNLGIF